MYTRHFRSNDEAAQAHRIVGMEVENWRHLMSLWLPLIEDCMCTVVQEDHRCSRHFY